MTILGKSSIWCKLFPKFEIWSKFRKFRKISKFWKFCRGMHSCSTSYPSGNQVDGSPLVAIRKQWLSRADLGPHKMMNQYKIFSSYQCFDGLPWEKCTENLVERMLKININVFNCKNENATTRPMISQNFRTFQKMRISEKISKKKRNFEFYKRERSEVYRMERHSTSPPCGNLVDGLPHDCHGS